MKYCRSQKGKNQGGNGSCKENKTNFGTDSFVLYYAKAVFVVIFFEGILSLTWYQHELMSRLVRTCRQQ